MCNCKITCPYCLGTKVIRKGLNTTGKKQRFCCKDCKRKFVKKGQLWFISTEQKDYIDGLLAERISLRGICRVVKISLQWLLIYIKNLYAALPDDLNFKPAINRVKKGDKIYIKLIDSELDEMWSFVGRKTNKRWIWIALCAQTRQIIAFHVGNRAREDAKKLWAQLPEQVQKYCLFHTDDWDAYKGVLPEERHEYSKMKKYTNHIERFNNTVRQRVSRLVRKALSFSKIEVNHIGAIKYFFCWYNLETQKKLGLNL